MTKVLVTGGCGYIGSHTLVELIENGFEVVSIDSNVRSIESILKGVKEITGVEVKNHKIDLATEFDKVLELFNEHSDAKGIIHFAAYKTVPESVKDPVLYYRNNINSLLNVLEAAEMASIPNFIFSSSCSVYGNPQDLPVTENTPIGEAECPYARTKQMGEEIVKDFCIPNKLTAINLRYFNPVGAHMSATIGEVPISAPNNLAPRITGRAIGKYDEMYVFGSDYETRDGTCIRDYIHVSDIANAHVKALEYLLEARNDNQVEVFNLGSGNGVSVLEAIHAFEKISGLKLDYEMAPRREGDAIAIYANNERATSKLNWKAKYTIEDMMSSAWKWEQYMNGKTLEELF